MHNSSTQSVLMPPMSPEEFQLYLQGQEQNCMLYDSEMIKEGVRQKRILERDAVKSSLKREEILYRQKIRMTKRTFFERQGAVWMQDINGAGQVIREVRVLACLIRGVRRYIREGQEDELFQLIVKDGERKVFSNLYGIELLKSPMQLQKTILCGYDETCSQQDKAAIWRWLWKETINLYDKAERYYLPALPGWYRAGEHYHLWAGNRSPELVLNKEIRGYKIRYTEGTEAVKISKFFNQKGMKNKETVGALLLVRIIALTGRLCTSEPIPISIILYGDSALTIAKELLSVSDTEGNIINLESDRLNVIRRKVGCLREDVAIFTLHSTESRSTRNRIQDVCSWVSSGYIEGNKVTVPYVFCIEKLTQNLPLKDSILIDADSICSEEWRESFTMVQSWWIDMIEKSGTLIVEQLQTAVLQKRKERKGIIKCITEILVEEIISLMNCNRDVGGTIVTILQSGIEMINEQILMQYEHILTVFHSQIVQMAERNQIMFSDNTNADFVSEDREVYYDSDFYYFPNPVLKRVCNEAKMDIKSLLAVKQQLISLGFVKLYRNNGNHNRELQVDIPIRSKNGKSIYISVFAIRRDFWDEDFGICLYERG